MKRFIVLAETDFGGQGVVAKNLTKHQADQKKLELNRWGHIHGVRRAWILPQQLSDSGQRRA